MKEKIKTLFKEHNKTPFEIAEIFQISQEEVINILNEFGYNKISDRKYYILKATQLTKEQKDFILGCLFGNGELKRYGKRSNFYLSIKEKDKNIILWKKYNIPNLVNVINQSNDSYWFNTVDHTELNTLRKRIYNNNKKCLTEEEILNFTSPLSLAVLFIDIGRVQASQTLRFQMSNRSLLNHQNLQKIFKINFNINSKVCEYIKNNIKYYYLSVNKRNTEILMNIIKPFIGEILRD